MLNNLGGALSLVADRLAAGCGLPGVLLLGAAAGEALLDEQLGGLEAVAVEEVAGVLVVEGPEWGATYQR